MSDDNSPGVLGIDWHRYGALVAVLMAVFGLLWKTAQQSRDIETQGGRLTAVETIQREDHDKLTEVREGVSYLVDRAKRRDDGKAP